MAEATPRRPRRPRLKADIHVPAKLKPTPAQLRKLKQQVTNELKTWLKRDLRSDADSVELLVNEFPPPPPNGEE